jgi:hypothetical protein
MGDDENLLKNRVWPVDMAGSDLDVPGSELDDDNESIGAEDGEKNSYSIAVSAKRRAGWKENIKAASYWLRQE